MIRKLRATEAAIGLCLVAVATPAAAEFEISIRAGVAGTDNIALATDEEAQDETVFQLIPSLRYILDSQRLDVDFIYEGEFNKYQDLDTTADFHRVDGDLEATLVDNLFYVQAGVLRTQAVRDPTVAIPPSTLPVSNNLIDLDELSLAPRIERRFGSSVTLYSEVRLEEVSYRDDELQDNSNRDFVFRFGGDQRGTGATWALRYRWLDTEYEEGSQFEYQEAGVELGYWVSPSTRIFGSYGKESPYFDPDNRSLEEPVWEGGFEYAVNRFDAEFAYGERSFGRSWRGMVDFDFERGEFSLSYIQDPSTTGRDFLQGRLINPTNPGEFLTQPGFAERYVLKRLESSLLLEFRRTDIRLTVFDEARDDRTTIEGDQLTDQTQTGGVFALTYQMGTRTSVALTGSLTNRVDDTLQDGERRISQASIEFIYQIARRSELSLLVSHANDESTQTDGEDYTANVAGLYFTFTF